MDNDFPPPTSPPANAVPPLQPPPPPYTTPGTPPLLPPARKPKAGRGWMIAALVLGFLLLLSMLGSFVSAFFNVIASAESFGGETRLQEVMIEHNRASDKIAVIPIQGIIASSGFDGSGLSMVQLVEHQLKLAGKDDQVKAVLLKVNSPGGEVLASDDIYNAILKFQNEHNKPVIASMGSLAASGGYYVSAPCRWIVANELTITGSIGVIMHGYNYRGLMNKVGLRPMVFKSGRFKDMLSGEKDLEKLTPAEKADMEEEEAMMARMINETFDRFKTVVAEGRKFSSNRNQLNKDGSKGRPLSDKWAALADGRILSGKEALQHGFVDELGNWRTAIRRAQTLAGIEKADLITYQMPFSLGNLLGILGKSEAKSIKVDLGFEMPKLSAGLYYLAPTFLR
jgi:protease-4